MSTEYGASAFVGVYMSMEDVKRLTQQRPEESHMESRWDESNGKKIADEEVIDQEERDVIVIKGEEQEQPYRFHGDLVEIIEGYLRKNFRPFEVVVDQDHLTISGWHIGRCLSDTTTKEAIKRINEVYEHRNTLKRLLDLTSGRVKIQGVLDIY